MGKNYLYTIYLFSVLLITIFISIWIINTNFSESRNFKNNDNILEPTGDCPCDKPGKELPGCERDFIVNEEKPWKLVKNYTGIYDGNVVCLNPSILNINSHGFRDREYKINKPNNTYRIIVLGDSISFGQGLNLSQIYHQRIERMLNTRLKNDAKYQVLNFGVVDLNTKMELEFFKEVGLKFDPDLVLLQYTANDFSNETGLRELINEKRKELFLSYSKNNDISVASIRTNEALNSKLSKIAHKRAKIEHKNMLHEKGRKKCGTSWWASRLKNWFPWEIILMMSIRLNLQTRVSRAKNYLKNYQRSMMGFFI